MFMTSDGDERDDRRSPGTADARPPVPASTAQSTPGSPASEDVSGNERGHLGAHDPAAGERPDPPGDMEPDEALAVVRPRDRWSIIVIAGVALGSILCMMIAVLVALFL